MLYSFMLFCVRKLFDNKRICFFAGIIIYSNILMIFFWCWLFTLFDVFLFYPISYTSRKNKMIDYKLFIWLIYYIILLCFPFLVVICIYISYIFYWCS